MLWVMHPNKIIVFITCIYILYLYICCGPHILTSFIQGVDGFTARVPRWRKGGARVRLKHYLAPFGCSHAHSKKGRCNDFAREKQGVRGNWVFTQNPQIPGHLIFASETT